MMEDSMQASDLVTLLLDGNAVLPDHKVQLTAQLSHALQHEKEITVQFEVDHIPVSHESYDRNKAVWTPAPQSSPPGARHVAIVRLFDKTGWQIASSQKRIYTIIPEMQGFNISAPHEPVTEGTTVALSAVFNKDVDDI